MAGGNRILIVENRDDVRDNLGHLLDEAGFENRTTWSGYDALSLLESNEFDGLVTDCYFPDLHAVAFFERVRQVTRLPWIVVMLSATPSGNDESRYLSWGASAIVDKRDPERVLRAVSACCNSARASANE